MHPQAALSSGTPPSFRRVQGIGQTAQGGFYPCASADGTALLGAAAAYQPAPGRALDASDADGVDLHQRRSSKQPGPCPFCGVREILVPFVALPCRHVFCWVCLRAQCEADIEFACPLDGQRVSAMRRLCLRVR